MQSPIRHRYDLIKPTSNKLFLCLRPVVMDDFLANSKDRIGNTSSAVLELINVEHKDGATFPCVFQSPEFDAAGPPRKKKTKKNFLRVIKAVLFETSLARKIKKRTCIKKKKHSNGEAISKVDMDFNLVQEKLLHQKHAKKFHAKNAIVPSMDSASSSINNSKRFAEKGPSSVAEEMTMEENPKGHRHGSDSGLLVLLFTLTVLVLWGKVFAILCTATLFFFVPNRCNIYCKKSLKHRRVFPQSMDMDDHKKKIIMEGLLDRNRNRLP